MAKMIIIDDNGSTIEMNFDEILGSTRSDIGHKFLMKALEDIPVGPERTAIISSIKHDMVLEHYLDKLYCCDCGMTVLLATIIKDGDNVSCLSCANNQGTARYSYLTRMYGGAAVREYFAQWTARANIDDNAVEEFVYYFTHGINADPRILDAGIINQLNELEEEDWFSVKHELEELYSK